jgi:hypothetical protein
MVNIGSIILNLMALVWATIALWSLHASPWIYVLPAAVSGLCLAFTASGQERRTSEEKQRIGKVVARASIGEGAGIPLAISACNWAGRPDLWVCALAGVVGIHFLPLAFWIPKRLYYFTAVALITVAAVGVFAPEERRVFIVAIGAATVLWVSALSFMRRRST